MLNKNILNITVYEVCSKAFIFLHLSQKAQYLFKLKFQNVIVRKAFIVVNTFYYKHILMILVRIPGANK